jgi:hypothetical protein
MIYDLLGFFNTAQEPSKSGPDSFLTGSRSKQGVVIVKITIVKQSQQLITSSSEVNNLLTSSKHGRYKITSSSATCTGDTSSRSGSQNSFWSMLRSVKMIKTFNI